MPNPAEIVQKTQSTRLAQALSNSAPAKATPIDVFTAAKRCWLSGERLDIGQLASKLGISRATAFRWVGSRDLLLGEVLWSLCDGLFNDCVATAKGHGVAYIASICESLVRAIVQFRPLRQFVRQDPEFALKLLTSKLGPVQRRSIERMRALLLSQAELGMVLPLSVDTLAYLLVRLCESFVYAEVISDQNIDVADAELAVQLLLSGRVLQAKPFA
jgi:AcrR family transcriptional regulator